MVLFVSPVWLDGVLLIALLSVYNHLCLWFVSLVVLFACLVVDLLFGAVGLLCWLLWVCCVCLCYVGLFGALCVALVFVFCVCCCCSLCFLAVRLLLGFVSCVNVRCWLVFYSFQLHVLC